VRPGTHHVVVLTGQEPGLLLGPPAFDLPPGTWGAHPMATRVRPQAFDMASGTDLHRSTPSRRAAGEPRPHRPPHAVRHRLRARIRGIPQLPHRVQRALIGAQALSIPASAVLSLFCLVPHLPRSMRVRPTNIRLPNTGGKHGRTQLPNILPPAAAHPSKWPAF
jgi:hypothetical protein